VDNPAFKICIYSKMVQEVTRIMMTPYLTQAIEDLGLTDKISIYTQPPNSPDLNILDLGLFNALQADYYDQAPKNEVELITMAEGVYASYDYRKINRLFVTLHTVLNVII
jgi:hypothetical protein